jgi:hypothetical protein
MTSRSRGPWSGNPTRTSASNLILGDGRRARRPRVEIDRVAKIRCGAEVEFVRVVDISQGGIKIETEQTYLPEADVVVTLEGFRPLTGVVRWQRDNHCGISFIQVIPIQELCDWLRSAD